jgi:GNAT superfamily N-acetyltransferase
MKWQRGPDTIDTDRVRLEMDTLVGWLRETYWAGQRPADEIRRSWANSEPVFGVYAGDTLVGCARVVSDFVSVAYLADVFLLPEHRGRGLGRWLVESIVAHPDLQTVKWLLHTRDAHGLYRQVGFGDPGPRLMERAAPAPRPEQPNVDRG